VSAATITQVPSEPRDVAEREFLGRLAARVGNEFEFVLGRLGKHVERLDEVAGDRAEVQDELHDTRELLARGLQLVRQLSAFGMPDARPAEAQDLRGSLGNWWPRLQRVIGSEHPLELHLRGSPIARIDNDAFALALENLCANARDASPAGSTIELHVRASPNAPIAIEVIDHGHGMNAELLARVGEPFFTTKPRRTGLGLAAARAIIDAHAGQLTITSSPGVGTAVHIRLPRAELSATESRLAEPGARPRPRALVVGAERLITRWLQRSLTSKGCEVRVANDVLEVREQLGRNWPELILVDRNLPDGDGRNLAIELAVDRPERPVLFASSRAQLRRDRDRCLTPLPEWVTIVDKPFSTRRFDEVARRVLADFQRTR
jgi:two-component system cell cycle sensor histidine kinase/response regulator CckA